MRRSITNKKLWGEIKPDMSRRPIKRKRPALKVQSGLLISLQTIRDKIKELEKRKTKAIRNADMNGCMAAFQEGYRFDFAIKVLEELL